ncbi:unnamed protein product [Blepharisma stoltei]|uniref:Uncharacterized protein n=1 Tax=Blepharisma stoltei TaxID=1481888 RepID=A0AAU9IS37_9CILI|nr:unnamed protein product [Blepharisma stoltei]
MSKSSRQSLQKIFLLYDEIISEHPMLKKAIAELLRLVEEKEKEIEEIKSQNSPSISQSTEIQESEPEVSHSPPTEKNGFIKDEEGFTINVNKKCQA